MIKMIKIVLASAVSMLILSGCGSANIQTAEDSISGGVELTLQGHTKTETVHDAIMKAGEKSGLTMTEFKSNAIIAEKADGDNSASATVTFTNDKVIIRDETGDIDAEDLLEAIEEELKGEEEGH